MHALLMLELQQDLGINDLKDLKTAQMLQILVLITQGKMDH